jgi:pteridine reductase
MQEKDKKVVLITGAARRVGACIAESFHENNYSVIIHYRHSGSDAQALAHQLNAKRADSAVILQANLDDESSYEKLIASAHAIWNRLDVLINNASSFAPTPIGNISFSDWNHLFNSNLKAPIFLSQAAAPFLKKSQGNIINITDVHADFPMKNYVVYSCAKAGLSMLTKSLALELAPDVRVNAVAPGNVIWPEGVNEKNDAEKKAIVDATLLKKQISPNDIAEAALFLAGQCAVTGQTIRVDGGRR